MNIGIDPDWYEAVSTFTECSCGGIFSGNCRGQCNGSGTLTMVPRTPEAYAKLKAEKRRLHEEAVLAEADAIRARRYQG